MLPERPPLNGCRWRLVTVAAGKEHVTDPLAYVFLGARVVQSPSQIGETMLGVLKERGLA